MSFWPQLQWAEGSVSTLEREEFEREFHKADKRDSQPACRQAVYQQAAGWMSQDGEIEWSSCLKNETIWKIILESSGLATEQ